MCSRKPNEALDPMSTRRTIVLLAALLVAALAIVLIRIARTPPAGEADRARESAEIDEQPEPDLSALDAPTRVEGTRTDDAQPLAQATGPTVELTGRVTARDERAAPLDGAAVAITDAAGIRRSATVGGGAYSIAGLAPGEFVLACAPRGFRAVERRFVLREGEPVHREDLALERAWTIAVKLQTPQGEDLLDRLNAEKLGRHVALSVLATTTTPGEKLQPSFRGDNSTTPISRWRGWLQDGATRDERLEILVDPPVHVSVVLRDVVLASRRVETPVEELTFTIDLEQIRSRLSGLVMRLADALTGRAVVDAAVMISTADTSSMAGRPAADGVVRAEKLAPGLYSIRILTKDHAQEERAVALEPGRVTDLGTIQLGAGTEVAGRIVDADGRPQAVDGALELLDEDGVHVAPVSRTSLGLEVDDDGRFSIAHVAPGRYALRVPSGMPRESASGGGDWTAAPVQVDTRKGPVGDLRIVVHRPVPLVLRPLSSDGSRIGYDVLSAEGISCARGILGGLVPRRLALAPGAYLLRLKRDGRVLRDLPFDLRTDPLVLDVAP
jgi:hypothetical protein